MLVTFLPTAFAQSLVYSEVPFPGTCARPGGSEGGLGLREDARFSLKTSFPA